jgi:chaperonin GroES
MNIKPVYDRVLVKRIEVEDKTPAGVVIPDVAKEKPRRGIVIEVGSGKTLDDGKVRPIEVKPGDQVIFGADAGDDVVLDEVDHVILSAEEILGKVV